MLRAVIDVVGRWRELERVVRDRELGWGLHHAPADLRYARAEEHALGGRVDHLLPADYRAFVAEVGYPVVGFGYYDRRGISFLPPEAMARLSVDLPDPEDVWPEAVAGQPTPCLHALFAGSDLSEIDGFSFGPGQAGGVVVWEVENGMPRKECGTFAEWLDGEVARLAEHATTWTPDPPFEGEEEEEPEEDPHRLLDYSLGGHYGQAPYSAADLDLHWVESDVHSGTWGLVDGAGTWLIPLGARFRDVLPFRDGVAEVVLEDAALDSWVRIRTDGTLVEQ